MSANHHDERPGPPHLRLAPAPAVSNHQDGDELVQGTVPVATQRPMKIVELDGTPRSRWRIDLDAVYLWKGRLWRKEKVGCVLCCEIDDNDHLTFATAEQRFATAFVCMQHGELCEVPYEMKKVYTVTIGSVVREGEERLNDTMLFPTEMTLASRNALIERLLDEAQQEEVEAGPAPTE